MPSENRTLVRLREPRMLMPTVIAYSVAFASGRRMRAIYDDGMRSKFSLYMRNGVRVTKL